MNLLNLAPEIQEAVLFLSPAKGGGSIAERHLRGLVQVVDWNEQRRAWSELRHIDHRGYASKADSISLLSSVGAIACRAPSAST